MKDTPRKSSEREGKMLSVVPDRLSDVEGYYEELGKISNRLRSLGYAESAWLLDVAALLLIDSLARPPTGMKN